MYFDKTYYLNKLNDFNNLNLDIDNINLDSSFYYEYDRSPLKVLIKKEAFLNIQKAFNKLHPNIKYLLNDYIIENNNLIYLAKKHNIKLLDLALYVEQSLDLLKYLYLELNNII